MNELFRRRAAFDNNEVVGFSVLEFSRFSFYVFEKSKTSIVKTRTMCAYDIFKHGLNKVFLFDLRISKNTDIEEGEEREIGEEGE